MALFHIDALLTNDLLQQIIKVDEVILYLKVRNPISWFAKSASLQGSNKLIPALVLQSVTGQHP